MNWLKKILGTSQQNNESYTSSEASPDSITAAVEILMRNQGDIEKCLPVLEQRGLTSEAISKIYNLTVIACGRHASAANAHEYPFPAHYVILDQTGEEHEVCFDSCEIYRIAHGLIPNFDQNVAAIGARSEELKALNWCLEKLGAAARRAWPGLNWVRRGYRCLAKR
jgi:hypothetical protein